MFQISCYLVYHLQFILFLLLASDGSAKLQHDPGSPPPTFGDPIRNITVIKSRDITFTCIVKHLGQYKVGWVKADTKAIQAIHHQVVTHNPRVSVTYRDRTTWNLHIRDVQEDDRGVYMCQVNTDPMIAEMAYLEVVVPPEILDESSSGETEVEEGASVSLICKAVGHPTPKVSWQREGSTKIVLRDHGSKKVSTVEGGVLNLAKLKRQDMGAYLCIAKNGIPPSVSLRILLKVNFKPEIEVPLHMVGAPLGNDVTISCRIESSPRAVNTWRKYPGEQMIISSRKYIVTEKKLGYYVTVMSLTVKNFTIHDVTSYDCTSSNSLGFSESKIQIYEIPAAPKLEKVNKDIDTAGGETSSKISNVIKDLKDLVRMRENLKNFDVSYNPMDNEKGRDRERTDDHDQTDKKSSKPSEENFYSTKLDSVDDHNNAIGFNIFNSGDHLHYRHRVIVLFQIVLLTVASASWSHFIIL